MTQIQDIQCRVNRTLYTVFFINETLNALLLCSTLLYSAMPSLAPCFEYSQPNSYVIFSVIIVIVIILLSTPLRAFQG